MEEKEEEEKRGGEGGEWNKPLISLVSFSFEVENMAGDWPLALRPVSWVRCFKTRE